MEMIDIAPPGARHGPDPEPALPATLGTPPPPPEGGGRGPSGRGGQRDGVQQEPVATVGLDPGGVDDPEALLALVPAHPDVEGLAPPAGRDGEAHRVAHPVAAAPGVGW